jgi:hypothetical protein
MKEVVFTRSVEYSKLVVERDDMDVVLPVRVDT